LEFKTVKEQKCGCSKRTDGTEKFCLYCRKNQQDTKDSATNADQNSEEYEQVLSDIASNLFEGGCCGTNF